MTISFNAGCTGTDTGTYNGDKNCHKEGLFQRFLLSILQHRICVSGEITIMGHELTPSYQPSTYSVYASSSEHLPKSFYRKQRSTNHDCVSEKSQYDTAEVQVKVFATVDFFFGYNSLHNIKLLSKR